jgi:hypothetical protein
MLGERKHDDCAYRVHRRDSCINKRRSKDSSLSDANSTADKMYNDDVAVANTQAAKHVSDTMDSQGEGNATHEGSQQEKLQILLIRCMAILGFPMTALVASAAGTLVTMTGKGRTIHLLTLIQLMIKCVVIMFLVVRIKLLNLFPVHWTAKMREM